MGGGLVKVCIFHNQKMHIYLIYRVHVTSLTFIAIYSQPMHLRHDLTLCTQITRERVDFNRDESLLVPSFQPATFTIIAS